jgi:hypothetical protein
LHQFKSQAFDISSSFAPNVTAIFRQYFNTIIMSTVPSHAANSIFTMESIPSHDSMVISTVQRVKPCLLRYLERAFDQWSVLYGRFLSLRH